MLRDWLASRPRPQRFAFDVRDTTEHSPPTERVAEDVGRLLMDCLIGSDLVEQLVGALGDETTATWVRESLPTTNRMQRGDFAEVLTAGLLSEFDGYVVPVQKLRYRVSANDSLTGGDVLAVLVNERDQVTRTCLAEAKFRSTRDDQAAIGAYKQLEGQAAESLPAIHRFVAQRLHEAGHALAKPFWDYLASRAEGSENESTDYRISLVWEAQAWNEGVLDELDANNPMLRPILVDAVTINGLVDFVMEILRLVSPGLVLDEDER